MMSLSMFCDAATFIISISLSLLIFSWLLSLCNVDNIIIIFDNTNTNEIEILDDLNNLLGALSSL